MDMKTATAAGGRERGILIDRSVMTSRGVRVARAAIAAVLVSPAFAQSPQVSPDFPPPPTYVPPADVAPAAPLPDPYQQLVVPVPVGAPVVSAVQPRTSIRDIFAGTLAAAANVTGMTLVAGLTQAITGGLANWFSRRTGAPPGAATSQPPAEVAPVPAVVDGSYATGTSTAGGPAVVTGGADASLYAGLAYEVHAIGPDGATVPVDPATHEFRTGERFVVHYRPVLPGRMEVYNINPAGRETQIDDAELAAGQLATLGPYEFASLKGDERLRLVLTPCTRPELVLATRDIVKVSAVTAGGQALGMATCGVVTRSTAAPATRDIRKVAVDGATAFALDPVSADERATGRFAPREVTIVFRHR